MKCKVLTQDRWRRFLEDNLSAEESRVINDHLGTDCVDCEEFFASLDSAAEKDLRNMYNKLVNFENERNKKSPDVRKLVHSFYAKTGDPTDSATDSAEPAIPWGARAGAIRGLGQDTLAWTGGVFAILLIAVGGLLLISEINSFPLEREKGISPVMTVDSSINLNFLIGQRLPDGKLEVSRGMNGASYRSDALLMLRFRIERSGYVYFMQSRDNKVDILYPPRDEEGGLLSAGQHQLSDDTGRLLAFPLDSAGGRRTIISVFSPVPLSLPDDLLSAVLKAINPSGKVNKRQLEMSLGKGVSADTVYFDVGA